MDVHPMNSDAKSAKLLNGNQKHWFENSGNGQHSWLLAYAVCMGLAKSR